MYSRLKYGWSSRIRFHDKNVAAVGGWLSSASMRDAMNQGCFQDPLGMLEVALFDPTQEEARAAG